MRIVRTDIFQLLTKIFRSFFFLFHLFFPKGNFRIVHQEFFRQRLFTHTANFLFTTINRRMAIWTLKFHF